MLLNKPIDADPISDESESELKGVDTRSVRQDSLMLEKNDTKVGYINDDDGSATPLADEIDYHPIGTDNESLKSFEDGKYNSFHYKKSSRSPIESNNNSQNGNDDSRPLSSIHRNSFDEEDSLPSFNSGDGESIKLTKDSISPIEKNAAFLHPISPDNVDSISSAEIIMKDCELGSRQSSIGNRSEIQSPEENVMSKQKLANVDETFMKQHFGDSRSPSNTTTVPCSKEFHGTTPSSPPTNSYFLPPPPSSSSSSSKTYPTDDIDESKMTKYCGRPDDERSTSPLELNYRKKSPLLSIGSRVRSTAAIAIGHNNSSSRNRSPAPISLPLPPPPPPPPPAPSSSQGLLPRPTSDRKEHSYRRDYEHSNVDRYGNERQSLSTSFSRENYGTSSSSSSSRDHHTTDSGRSQRNRRSRSMSPSRYDSSSSKRSKASYYDDRSISNSHRSGSPIIKSLSRSSRPSHSSRSPSISDRYGKSSSTNTHRSHHSYRRSPSPPSSFVGSSSSHRSSVKSSSSSYKHRGSSRTPPPSSSSSKYGSSRYDRGSRSPSHATSSSYSHGRSSRDISRRSRERDRERDRDRSSRINVDHRSSNSDRSRDHRSRYSPAPYSSSTSRTYRSESRSRSRSPSKVYNSMRRSNRDRTPPLPYDRPKDRGESRSSTYTSYTTQSSSSNALLNQNKFSSSSFAAELMNKIKAKKLQPGASNTATTNDNSNSLTPTSTPLLNEIIDSQNGSGSLTPQKGGTPIKTNASHSTSRLAVSDGLPLPPINFSLDNAENQANLANKTATTATGSTVKPKRPHVIGKPTTSEMVRRETNPRCVDVFKLISQIGEGTYGQVYKARDTDNW